MLRVKRQNFWRRNFQKFFILKKYSFNINSPQIGIRKYSDSQNYVYSDKFFLSRPLLQWKKKGEIWKNYLNWTSKWT